VLLNTLITGDADFREVALNATLQRTPNPLIVRDAASSSLCLDNIMSGTLVIQGVEQLSASNQTLLMTWLDVSQVRIVAVSDVSLFDRVQQRRFRADLYYRLCTVHVCPGLDAIAS
jgi:hypothetical protein